MIENLGHYCAFRKIGICFANAGLSLSLIPQGTILISHSLKLRYFISKYSTYTLCGASAIGSGESYMPEAYAPTQGVTIIKNAK